MKLVIDIISRNKKNFDYDNWYVLHTFTGLEYKVKNTIQSLFGDSFLLYLPARELIHTIKGKSEKKILPLFPGYIFIYKKIDKLLNEMKRFHLNDFIKPLLCNDKFAKVYDHEMKFLIELTGIDGMLKTSEGIIQEDKSVKITNGPLKDLTGQIVYIDKRKKKAKVKMSMLNQEVEVTVGLEILNIV